MSLLFLSFPFLSFFVAQPFLLALSFEGAVLFPPL